MTRLTLILALALTALAMLATPALAASASARGATQLCSRTALEEYKARNVGCRVSRRVWAASQRRCEGSPCELRVAGIWWRCRAINGATYAWRCTASRNRMTLYRWRAGD